MKCNRLYVLFAIIVVTIGILPHGTAATSPRQERRAAAQQRLFLPLVVAPASQSNPAPAPQPNPLPTPGWCRL